MFDQHLEAEQAVLGSMLIDAGCIDSVMEKLRSDDFALKQNQDIFSTIRTMHQDARSIDGVTVAAEMERNGTYDSVTTRTYLAELMEVTPTSANVLEYADIVRDHARRRKLVDALREAEDGSGYSTDELLATLRGQIERLQQDSDAKRRGILSTGEASTSFLDELASQRAPAIPTGLPSLSNVLGGGLIRGGLIVVAARPGMGKTTLALNLAEAIGAEGAGVLFVSLEMSPSQLMAKRFARLTGIDAARLTLGDQLTEREWQKIAEATGTLSKSGIFINRRPGASVAGIEQMAKQVPNLQAIFVDYLGLVRPEQTGSRYETTSASSNELKQLAVWLDIPVVLLCQLSRANEKRESKVPQLADLRDSGAIEQDADVVIFLYRDDYYNSAEDHRNPWAAVPLDCIIAKNRHGPTGVCRLEAQLHTSVIREAPPLDESTHPPAFTEIPERGDEPF